MKDHLFKSGLRALRIRQLPKNSVQFEIISNEVHTGIVEHEATNEVGKSVIDPLTGNISNSSLFGLIRFDYKNGSSLPVSKTITYLNSALVIPAESTNKSDEVASSLSQQPQPLFCVADKVQFNLSTCIKSNKQTAVNVRLVEACKEQGYITMLKENYGFIELVKLDPQRTMGKTASPQPRDIFFHFRLASHSFY